jgi:hypothetical protein
MGDSIEKVKKNKVPKKKIEGNSECSKSVIFITEE